MTESKLKAYLEQAWEPGVLSDLRQGIFRQDACSALVEELRSFNYSKQTVQIDRNVVRLLWYLPLFLSWQTDRIRDQGGDVEEYRRFENAVATEVERILGIP